MEQFLADTQPEPDPPLVQIEAITSCAVTSYMGEEASPCFFIASFQVVVESNKVNLEPLPDETIPVPPATPCETCSRSSQLHCPSLGMLQGLSVPSSEGPKQNTWSAASPVLGSEGQSVPCFCCPHYFWSRPKCCWPSWPPGCTAELCSADHWPAGTGLFLLGSFPVMLYQVKPCWMLYDWMWPINSDYPDISAGPSCSQADQQSPWNLVLFAQLLRVHLDLPSINSC